MVSSGIPGTALSEVQPDSVRRTKAERPTGALLDLGQVSVGASGVKNTRPLVNRPQTTQIKNK